MGNPWVAISEKASGSYLCVKSKSVNGIGNPRLMPETSLYEETWSVVQKIEDETKKRLSNKHGKKKRFVNSRYCWICVCIKKCPPCTFCRTRRAVFFNFSQKSRKHAWWVLMSVPKVRLSLKSDFGLWVLNAQAVRYFCGGSGRSYWLLKNTPALQFLDISQTRFDGCRASLEIGCRIIRYDERNRDVALHIQPIKCDEACREI